MTPKQIAERLARAQTALVEKLEAQPWTSLDLDVQQSGRVRVVIYGDMKNHSTQAIGQVHSSSFASTLDALDQFIANLPDLQQARIQNWQKNLAKVIDEGNALNIPNDVIALLQAGSQAMTENLLT